MRFSIRLRPRLGPALWFALALAGVFSPGQPHGPSPLGALPVPQEESPDRETLRTIDDLLGKLRTQLEQLSDEQERERALTLIERLEGHLASIGEESSGEPAPVAAPAPTPARTRAAVESVNAEVPLPAPSGCLALVWMDSNADGKLSGADRYWRHLRLRTSDGKTTALFALGVREMALDLRTWKGAKELVGDVLLEGWRSANPNGSIWLRLESKRRRAPTRGQLALDGESLARSGGPRLVSPAEAQHETVYVLRPGQVLERANGERFTLGCGPR